MGIVSRALKGKGPSVDGTNQGMGGDAVGTGTEVEQRVPSLHPSHLVLFIVKRKHTVFSTGPG